MADDACGRVFPGDVGVGFGADVYRVFQAGGDGAVVFGGNEQYAVGSFDGFAEGGVAFGRREVGFRRGRRSRNCRAANDRFSTIWAS